MRAQFNKLEEIAEDLSTTLNDFSANPDCGIASDKIPFITRAILEASQLASDTALGLCAVGRQAVNNQMATEEEILETLDNFTKKALS